MTLIIDSFAWIEYLAGGRLGTLVRSHLESPETMVTPDIVLAELARRFYRDGGTAVESVRRLTAVSTLSRIAPIDVGVALEVGVADRDLRARARVRRLSQPSFADSILLAFARFGSMRVLTGDPHFEGLPETLWLGG